MSGVIGANGSKTGLVLPKGGYSFYVYNANFTQGSSGYWTANVAVVNIGNCFDLTNNKFVVPVTGTYQLHFHALYRGTSYIRTWWDVDGSKFNQPSNGSYSDGYTRADHTTVSMNGIFDFNAGQEVQIYAYIDSGGDLYGNANGHNGFSGHLIV